MAATDLIHSLAAGKHSPANFDVFLAAFTLHSIRFPRGGGILVSDGGTKGHIGLRDRSVKRRTLEDRSASGLSPWTQDFPWTLMEEQWGLDVGAAMEKGIEKDDTKKGLERFLTRQREGFWRGRGGLEDGDGGQVCTLCLKTRG